MWKSVDKNMQEISWNLLIANPLLFLSIKLDSIYISEHITAEKLGLTCKNFGSW